MSNKSLLNLSLPNNGACKQKFLATLLFTLVLILFTLAMTRSGQTNTWQGFVDPRSWVDDEVEGDSRLMHVTECGCDRWVKYNKREQEPAKPLSDLDSLSTCSSESSDRGYGQKVIAYTFYETSSSHDIYKRDYFAGVEENLRQVEPMYGPDWIMRLYFEVPRNSSNFKRLCQLACSNPNFELCDATTNPRFGNMHKIYPLVWRFFPVLDPYVDVLLVRDLDSHLSLREVNAVTEFMQSEKQFHIMRDHKHHGSVIMGGTWGVKLGHQAVREQFKQSIAKFFTDKSLMFAKRGIAGPDQTALARHVWPWARQVALAHDSFLCKKFSSTSPFPSKRPEGVGNFVGAVISINNTIEFTSENQCPVKCRPKLHKDWLYC